MIECAEFILYNADDPNELRDDNIVILKIKDKRGIFYSLINTSFASKSSKCLAVQFSFRGASAPLNFAVLFSRPEKCPAATHMWILAKCGSQSNV